MATWKRLAGAILLSVLLLPMAACGLESVSSSASGIEVTDITSPLTLFAPAPFTITGLNFTSVAGTDVVVRFTADGGVTPFDGGTSDTADVPGTVVSNTEITGLGPTSAFVGFFDAFVTVILPTTARGTSETPIAQFVGADPEANDDDYDTAGNVLLAVDAANGVLANDVPPGFVTVSAFDALSANGALVTVNADGSFTYDPPVGFEGLDTFTYEITAGATTDTATVTIDVTGMVWFLDASAAPGGDGRQSSPFEDVAAFSAIQGTQADPGDTIFLYLAGGAPYTGPLTLLDDQILLGQGVALEIGGETIVPASSNPTLTGASGTTLTLATNNTVRGLDIGNTAGGGITGTAAGTLTVDTVNVDVTGGRALSFDGVTAAATFGSVQSAGSADYGLWLTSVDGTLTIDAGTTVTDPSTFAVVVNLGSGVVNFDGLQITTTTAAGLVTLGGAQTNVTGTGNFVTTTTGQPLDLHGAIGSSGITFESVSCDGAAVGILMGATTGTLGSLTITGDGTGLPNGSGGTLQNCSGAAVVLNGAPDVSLTQLDVDTTGGHGMHLDGVTDFAYALGSVVRAGDSDDEYGIFVDACYGEVLIEDVVFDDINETAIQVTGVDADDAVTDLVTIRSVDVQDHTPAGFGEHGVTVAATGTADLDVLIDNSTFDINGDGLLGVLGITSGTSTLVLTVENSTFLAADAFGSGCIQLQAADTSTATFNVLDNDLNLSGFTSILVNNDDDATSYATIQGNDIDADGVTNNGFGISLRQDENGTFTVLIDDNTVDGHGFDGIRAIARDTTDGTGTMNVTLTDNVVGIPFSFGAGIYLDVQDVNTLCANVSGNDATGANLLPGLDDDIVLDESVAASLLVTQLAPTPAVDPSELDDANNNASVGVSGTPLWGQPPCPTPPVAP